MTLKRGSVNSFLSASRLSDGSTSGFMNAVKSVSNVSESTGGSATSAAFAVVPAAGTAVDAGTTGGGVPGAAVVGASRATACLRCDQRLSEKRSRVGSSVIASVYSVGSPPRSRSRTNAPSLNGSLRLCFLRTSGL